MSVTTSDVEISAWIDGTSSGEAAGRSGASDKRVRDSLETAVTLLPQTVSIFYLPTPGDRELGLTIAVRRAILPSRFCKTFRRD